MLYTDKEIIFFSLFYKTYLRKYLFNKGVNTLGEYKVFMDFWLKEKTKNMLVYKASVFFALLQGYPKLILRSKKQSFRHKFKPDTFFLENNLRFLLNCRHFLSASILKRRGDYKNINAGFVFLNIADYIKSNTIDFYQANVSFRIMFKQI